ncbi:MAG: alpha/beta hydrolase-fold protein [Nitrospirota bacterium]|nr:alpha/beta hydrolase-fold protein [Nitrospirota bacterium]
MVFLNSPKVLATGDDKAQQKLEQPSLVSLIRGYVEGPSGQSGEGLLKTILNHPSANVKTIEAAIRAIPHYGKASVGAQPHRSILVRGRRAEYALYVPPSYAPDQSYPLILCLHGAGFTGESYLERWVPRLEDRYILACPTISVGAWWTRFGEDLTLATLRAVQAEYHVDPDRIFLTGMSNGGIGAWIIGMHHADLFAGIAPMASGLDDVMFPFVENLVNTPVYVIHGEKDRIMPVQLSRDLVQEMKRRGIPHRYREHDWTHPHAGGHFFPRQELPELIAWFDQQHRTSLPRQVSMVRDATHLTSLSWVRIDMTEHIAAFSENLIDSRDQYITGMIYAKLHAEITGQNTIVVNTVRVKRYTLFLNDALVDFSQPIIVKTNGVKSFEGLVNPSLETLLQDARQRTDVHILYSAKLTINLPSSQ